MFKKVLVPCSVVLFVVLSQELKKKSKKKSFDVFLRVCLIKIL